MDHWLARLERRFGRYAIPDLSLVIVGGMVIVLGLSLVQPEMVNLLTLDLDRVLAGEIWRLVTYVFIPQRASLILTAFALYMLWMMGSSLEQSWGPFKFNIFYLLGMVGTTVAAFISGGSPGNMWLNLSVFLAYAAVFPESELQIFFVIPVRVKWLGLLAVVSMVLAFVQGDWVARAAIAAGLGNTMLFFGHRLPTLLRPRVRGPLAKEPGTSVGQRPVVAPDRSCAICGATEKDGADIRVCNCEKCGGKLRTLCLDHARNH